MNIFVQLAIMVLSAVIQAMLAPKPKAPVAGKLDVPSVEIGKNIPVCFGTNIIKNGTVAWYGDTSTIPIMSKGGKK